MAHESFEDPATAEVMNRLFVNVKVDREERPDVDAVYMQAVQALTGSGGWPMTVLLTPDGRPFFGGTYFPQRGPPRHAVFTHGARGGRRRVAATDATSCSSEQASKLDRCADRPSTVLPAPAGVGPRSPDARARPSRTSATQFDPSYGGFGRAPKFPQAMTLDFLLPRATCARTIPTTLEMITTTLDAMAARRHVRPARRRLPRYSTDEDWLVPHFEKMLYDNALLTRGVPRTATW